MGKTKIKTIDDSAQEENQESRIKNKASKKKKASEGRLTPNAASSRQGPTEVGPSVPEASESEPQGSTEGAVSEQESGSADQSKSQKPGKAKPGSLPRAKPRGKKYQEISKDLDRTKIYPLEQTVDTVKKMSYSKFNATLDISINTVQTGLRGFVSLPYASGKKLRILTFGPSQPQIEGVIFGTDSTIDDISQGKVNFDLIIATPEWMPKLIKVAKILGPKGLMPNPKNGTITDDLKKSVESFQTGKTEYKTETKAPIIHLALGKLNQPNEELTANIKTLLQTIGKTRIKKVVLSPTMGPSIKLDLSSI